MFVTAAADGTSAVMKTALSNVSADGKQTFRTSLFGFNKEAVNGYIDKLCSGYSAEEARLNQQIQAVEAEKEELNAKVEGLENQLSNLHMKVSYELSFIKSFHEREQGYRANIGQLSDTISILAGKLKTAGEINSQLNEKLKEVAEEKADAESKMAIAQNEAELAVKERQKIAAELEELSADNERNQQEIIKRDGEITANLDTLAEKNATIESLNDRIIEKEVSGRRTQQELAAVKQRLQQIAVAYNASQEKLKELQKQLEQQSKTATDLKGQVAVQSRSATTTVQGYEQKVATLQHDIKMLQVRNSELVDALNLKTSQIQQLAERYNDLVKDIKRKESTITDLRREVSDFSRKQMDYEFKVNSLNGDVVRHEISLSQRDNQILMLRQQLSNLETKLSMNEAQKAEEDKKTVPVVYPNGKPVINVAVGNGN